ncbi:hypothetical protein Tco_0800382 [Tanacetum coccineum]|uniref:Xylulose kinase-1 n=1 Tax=Tanacetum coccineum TaxID=301880 RepID=A0ABQ4ZT19_9ASTR
MTTLKFAEDTLTWSHFCLNAESDGFEQIVDFLDAHPIKFALTVNLTIYISCIEQFWSTVKAKAINGEVQLHALVDGKKIIISEASIRSDLKLEDEECNILQSDEDRLKLNELMELCTTLQKNVLDLEKTKTTQANEIASLKRRVKKLEKKRSSRTHKLKRLYKVGLIDRVESFGDKEYLGEDASKQEGRINAINADEDITLVNVQDDVDNEMFDVDALNDEKVFVAGQNENVIKEVVDVAQVSTAATTVTITTIEITLAQALEALKTSKPKVKGIGFQELSTTTIITRISSQQSQDKGKGIMIEEFVKPMKKKDQISFDEEAKIEADHELAQRLQAEEQEELSTEEKEKIFQQLLEKRRKTDLVEGSSKRVEELEQECTKKQKVDEDKDTTEHQSLMEVILNEEEIAIDDIPLATKSLTIVDWKIHKEGKNNYF